VASPAELRVLGEWWLAERPERRVPGILTHSPATGTELELIGTLDTASHVGGTYGRVCGHSERAEFTLDDCHTKEFRQSIGHQGIGTSELVHVNTVLRGTTLGSGEPVRSASVTAHLLHLPYWVGQGGIEERTYFPGREPGGEPAVSLSLHRTPEIIFNLGGGATLTLTERISHVGDGTVSRGLARDFVVRLRDSERPLSELIKRLAHFRDLISVGLDQTCTFEAVTVSIPRGNGVRVDEAESVEADFLAQWTNWATRTEARPAPGTVLFHRRELGDDAVVERWIAAVERHPGVLDRTLSSRYMGRSLASDALLNRAAALEALDRGIHKGEARFKARMLRLAELAGEPFARAVPDLGAWVRLFKDRRNDAAHHLNPTVSVGPTDYYLAEVAYFLVVLCFLSLAGAGPEAVERVSQHPRLAMSGERLLG
jgi:hypothetical protein